MLRADKILKMLITIRFRFSYIPVSYVKHTRNYNFTFRSEWSITIAG